MILICTFDRIHYIHVYVLGYKLSENTLLIVSAWLYLKIYRIVLQTFMVLPPFFFSHLSTSHLCAHFDGAQVPKTLTLKRGL